MKPTGEFFQSLGQYVYQYIDKDTLEPYYIGKGNGDRCYSHVNEKGFDPKDCYIIAKNLERFEDKKDWQSFLLESFLISTKTPENNSVSGHYKECFEMASLSSMFSDFQTEQYDNFAQFPDWYLNNYEVFRNRLREVKINSGTTFVLSNARNAMYMMWYAPVGESEDPIKITFEINLPDGEKLESYKNQLTAWIKSNGYKNVKPDGKVQKLAIDVPSIDDAVDLFKEFWA